MTSHSPPLPEPAAHLAGPEGREPLFTEKQLREYVLRDIQWRACDAELRDIIAKEFESILDDNVGLGDDGTPELYTPDFKVAADQILRAIAGNGFSIVSPFYDWR